MMSGSSLLRGRIESQRKYLGSKTSERVIFESKTMKEK
jgi:hypothetical protein